MAESVTLENLAATLRRQVQALKRPIMDAARQFGAVREKLSDLAPKVVKLFATIQAEHERVTFVEFVRMFDPSVPTHAPERNGVEGYRTHKTYYTLDYMRRLARNRAGQGRPRGQQGVRDSATDALARTLATVLQVVENPEPVWAAIQQEFGFTERLLTRLRKRVEETKPLVKLAIAKPLKVGNVVHMERRMPEAAPQPAAERDREKIVLPTPGQARKGARKRAAA
jgi:AraC-like DNA-binding protein